MDTVAVLIDALSISFGMHQVVRDVSLKIPPRAMVSLLGPSGCGKTTILKLLAGYLTPGAGTIHIDGRDVTQLPPQRRNVGMVFQQYALFPHMTARQNVAFGPEARGESRSEINRRVDELLERVGLSTIEGNRRPHQLSGGQQQRVALARALACQPPLLLLDEPLASLDRHLRDRLCQELCQVHRRSHCVTIMVTHDPAEALAVSDLIGVMHEGRLAQFGAPRDLYERPRTPFVAQALGDANIVEGQHIGRAPGSKLLIRPENIVIGQGDHVGRVTDSAFHGASQTIVLDCGGYSLKARCDRRLAVARGDSISFELPGDGIWTIPEGDASP